MVGLVAATDPGLEEPTPIRVFKVGTVAIIHRLIKAPNGAMRIIVQGVERIRIDEWLTQQPYLKAGSKTGPDILPPAVDLEAEAVDAQRDGAVQPVGGVGAASAR